MRVQGFVSDDWQSIDQTIVDLAARKGQLDLEIGDWLLAAKRVRIHTHLGFGSFTAYVSQRLGYQAKSALERLRVADALQQLPKLRRMLARGERPWTAVREITRQAKPETEDAWIARTEGKTVREIEQMVARDADGKGPDATYRVVLELPAPAYADFLAAAEHVRMEIGPAASLNDVFVALVHKELGQRSETEPGYQTALTICPGCQRVWRREAGQSIEVADAVGGCARCDSEVVGAAIIDTTPDDRGADGAVDVAATTPVEDGANEGAVMSTPVELARDDGVESTSHVRRLVEGLRCYVRRGGAPGLLRVVGQIFAGPMLTVTPALRKAVRARDGGRCVVPGCTNHRFVDIHHLIPVARGGPNKLENIVSMCTAHHQQLHDGVLAIARGRRGGWVVHRESGVIYGGPPQPLPS